MGIEEGHDCRVILITTPSQEEAEVIARSLVQEGLAACVNLLPTVQSLYTWEGRLETSQECLMIVKGRASTFEQLARRVKEMHSYEVPEIISIVVDQGDTDYLSWIRQVTRSI